MARRGRVVGLVLAGAVQGDPEVEHGRRPAPRAAIRSMRSIGPRRTHGDPQAAVRCQALLGSEVVDVEACRDRPAVRPPPRWRRRPPGRRRRDRRVDGRPWPRRWRSRCGSAPPRRSRGWPTRSGWVPGRRLGDQRVDPGGERPPRRRRTWRRIRRRRRGGCLLDQTEGGGVPEQRAPTVAQEHLVAVGKAEELGRRCCAAHPPRRAPPPGGGWCRGSRGRPRRGRRRPPGGPWRARTRSGRRRAGCRGEW